MAWICCSDFIYGTILAGRNDRIYVGNGTGSVIYVLHYRNVTNLRMPATIGTINSLGIKPNTEECHTMAIIACGASVITTVVIVALGVVIATPLGTGFGISGDQACI